MGRRRHGGRARRETVIKMQYANAHGGAAGGTSASGGLGQWLAGLVQTVRTRSEEHARYVRTRDELSALTERELNDIGLGRGDIEHVARLAARTGA
jgi:uncharacterized protein YjiS (DUF1127 family)